MNRYHITFSQWVNVTQEDGTTEMQHVATGKNYDAADEVEAILQWRAEYKDKKVTFLYCASKEMFEYKY